MNAAGAPGLTLAIKRPNHHPVQIHRGAANVELAVPIAENTTFNVGSVAKQMTAHLAVLAARSGQVNLDQPAGHLLPRLRIKDLSLGDLITHQGGIRDAESLLSLAGFRDLDHYTSSDLLELAYRQTERAVPPGTFLYSNTGYLLLVEALQNLHGCELEELAQNRIFSPLGMASTRFKVHPAQVIMGAAASYEMNSGTWMHRARPVALPGPGCLWSSAEDLHRWLEYLDQEWDAKRPDLPFAAEIGYRPGDREPYLYGPGLYADPQSGHPDVFHYGHEHGFSAATILTGMGLRIVCLSNQAALVADHIASEIHNIIESEPDQDQFEEILDRTVTARLAAIPAESAARSTNEPEHQRTIFGTYTCDQIPGSLRLSRRSGTLYLWRRGTQSALLEIGPGRYAMAGGTIQLMADQDDSQIPSGFVLDLDRAPGLRYRRT